MKKSSTGLTLTLTLIASLCLPLRGNPSSEFRIWKSITARDGLSSDSVTAIAKDRFGFLWVGTSDGLNRYDGYGFHVYKHHSFDSESLSDNFVSSLLTDMDGRLWIGTSDGLDLYEPETDNFRHLRPQLEKAAEKHIDRVHSLALDARGRLLVAASGGCFLLLQKEMLAEILKGSDGVRDVTAITCDPGGRVWLGSKSGIHRLESGSLAFINSLSGLESRMDAGDPGANDVTVTGFYFQPETGRVFVTSSSGLTMLTEKTPERWQARQFRSDPQRTGPLTAADFAWKLVRDSQGTVWLGAGSDIAQVQLPGSNDEKLICRIDFAGRGDRLRSTVRAIFEERPGVLWIGSFGGGLVRMSAPEWRFELFAAGSQAIHAPRGFSVFAMAEDKNGAVWIGTERGLDRFDPGSGAFRFLPGTLSPGDPPPANTIRFIRPEDDGSLWLCTMHTLKRFFPGSGPVRDYWDMSGPSPQTIIGRSMVQRKSGSLLVGGVRGLFEYDAASDRFLPATDPVFKPLAGLFIYTLHEDARGRLWAGSFGKGLFVHDPTDGSLRRFANDPKDSGSISDNSVMSIHQESERTFWIGTRDGLNRMEWPQGRFRRYFEEDGLPNAVIYSILPDAEGGLWLSTNKGLSRLDPGRGRFRNFFLEDGLQNNEFNGNAYLRSRSGNLYFGGIRGFNSVPPRSTGSREESFPLVITGFKVFGMSAASPSTLVASGGKGKPEIVLSHRQNFFSIEYALLDFEEAGKKEYAFRMDGMDKDWVGAGTRNFVSYTNLPPGRYLFRVRGAGGKGRWSDEATLAIRITPPFHKTAWFTLFLVFAGLAAAGEVFLLGRLIYRKRMVERDLRLKSDLAAMVVHDLRNPLTAIQGFAKLLRKKHDEKRLEENLEIIELNAGRMLYLVNDLLDISKFEAGKMQIRPTPVRLESLISEAVRMVRPQLSEKDLHLDLGVDPAPPLPADGERIGQVLVNLLGNAIKFSPPEGAIQVRLRWLAFGLRHGQRVEVEDHGAGVAPERQRFLFDKYAQLNPPGSGSLPKGTGLGLAVSKLIVEAHGGEIGYERRDGASIFYFFLPDKPEPASPQP